MAPARLVDRRPEVAPAEIVAGLVPPPRFDAARFVTYRPDPAQPSQAEARARGEQFATRLATPPAAHRSGLLRRKDPVRSPGGLYFDGGFGVGKTHLLAALWHAAPEPKAYATFVELTSLTGVLGFADTVEALAPMRLVAIDEFELDDPGDTMLVSTLLGRLVERGVGLAATSNTQPEDLGAGRFAADDFLREIQGLSAHFTIVRVDGEDYRHRGLAPAPEPLGPDALEALAAATPGATLDDFDALCAHLAGLHPSRYGALVADVPLVCLAGLHEVLDQDVALRLVVLVDRLYDRSVPVAVSGQPVDALFGATLLAGPYRKKYSRAISRLGALAREAAAAGS